MPPEISLKAEPIFHIGSFIITNSLLAGTITAIVIVGLATWFMRRGLVLVPGIVQNMAEAVTEAILDLMDSVLGNRSLSQKYLPLVASIFLFIITANWLGLLPGVGSIVVKEESHTLIPLLRAPAADLNFTFALGIIAILAVHTIGVGTLGIRAHGKKFLNFKSPILFFVGILEFLSEFAKIVSFSFRLFGNVFAGEVLLTIVAFLVPVVVPLPFLFLEIFVGFIQALIFSMLTLVFLASAISHEAEH